MSSSWFKQLTNSLHFLKKLQKTEKQKQLSDRVLGMRLCAELKNHLGKRFDPTIACTVRFESVCVDILTMIELIKEINFTLKKEEPLKAQRCYFTETIVNMDSFFHTKDGYYIPHSKISEYCKQAEMFYTLTGVCEDAEVGVHEHNNRMLTKFYVGLKNVNTALMQVLDESAALDRD